MSRLRPIDENFNETYANRGLQPTYQVIAEKRQIATDAMRGQSLIRDVRVGPQRAPIERAFSASSPRDVRITNRSGPAKTRVAHKKLTRKAVVRQAKATSTCISILSWGMTIWTLQLWLALGSIVAFGAAGALDSIMQTATGEFLVRGSTILFNGILEAASAALGFTVSADVLEAIPALAVLALLLTWLIGLITLMTMGVQCMLAGLRPLSGQGASIKHGVLILVLIGYFIPIANLVPWFVFWCLAIWRYPR